MESLKRILINLGAKVYWPISEETSSSQSLKSSSLSSSTQNEATQLLILNNIKIHSNLFDNIDSSSSSSSNSNITIRQQDDVFETASLYLAMCSYRNQLVQFLVRISFVSNCLLALDFNQAKSRHLYKQLTLIFSREFIFHAGDHAKDFNEALSYLVHTNVLKTDLSLVKFNVRIFFFFARTFLYIFQDYAEIYAILSQETAASRFDSEKAIIKSAQLSLFDKMKSHSRHLCDFESLSLNLISNSLLSLRQFGVLVKLDSGEYVLDKAKLSQHNETLRHLIQANRRRLAELNKEATLFDGKVERHDFDYFSEHLDSKL
jgi:hypothetical protein